MAAIAQVRDHGCQNQAKGSKYKEKLVIFRGEIDRICWLIYLKGEARKNRVLIPYLSIEMWFLDTSMAQNVILS